MLLQQVKDVPGVTKMIDWFATDDYFYIVMEQQNGMDLFDYITKYGPLKESLAKDVFSKVSLLIWTKEKQYKNTQE